MQTRNPYADTRRSAFTLIELLAAIAIVAVLVVIGSAGMFKMRKTASQAGCVSNLRQIGMAWHLYLADNNRTFPAFNTYQMYYWGGGKGTWGGPAPETRPLYPYLPEEKVFRCPSDVSAGGRGAFYELSGNCYAMANSAQRGILSRGGATNRVPISGVYDQLQKPAATILVFEQTVRASEPGYKNAQTAAYYRRNWHPNDVSNVLMADGHVETFSRAFLDASPHPLNPEGYTWGWSHYSGPDW